METLRSEGSSLGSIRISCSVLDILTAFVKSKKVNKYFIAWVMLNTSLPPRNYNTLYSCRLSKYYQPIKVPLLSAMHLNSQL